MAEPDCPSIVRPEIVGEEPLTETAWPLEKLELFIVTPDIVALDTPLMEIGRSAAEIVQPLTDAPPVLTTTPVQVPELAFSVILLPLSEPFTVRLAPEGKFRVALELPVRVTPDGTLPLPAIGHDPEPTVVL